MSEQNIGLFEELQKVYRLQNVEPYGDGVLVIPSRDFKKKWEQTLKNEGVKVLMNSHNGRSCFFLRKTGQRPSEIVEKNIKGDNADNNGKNEDKQVKITGQDSDSKLSECLRTETLADRPNDPPSDTAENHTILEDISPKPKPKRKRRAWTEEELQNLQKLHSDGKSNKEIARKLGRSLWSVESRLKPRRQTHEKAEPNTVAQQETTKSNIGISSTGKRPIEIGAVKQHLESSILLIDANRVQSARLLLREANRLLEEVEEV